MNDQTKEEFTFILKELEANIILAGLSKLPYETSAAVIEKLKTQYINQTTQTEGSKD